MKRAAATGSAGTSTPEPGLARSWATTFYQVARNALTSDLEYRSSYVILVLSSLITVAMELAIFRQVYRHNQQAGDLHASDAAAFIVLGMVIRTGSVLWALVREMIDQIRDGSFRRFLLQPLHFPSFFMAQTIGPKMVTWTLAIGTVLVARQFAGFESLVPDATAAAQLVVAIALSYALTWSLYLSMVYVGFWVEEASFLMVAFNIGVGVFSGSLLPLSWLPEGVRAVLQYTPLPILGDFPIRAGLGTLNGGEFEQYLALGAGWLALVILANAWLRRAAFRAYEAYGG